jgi:hypothetical protein
MTTPKDARQKDEITFGPGADRRLARAVLDAGRAAGRAAEGSARAKMLEGLRTAAAGVAAALTATRHTARSPEATPAARQKRKKAATALLVACGGLEQAIRAVVPAPERRGAHRVEPEAKRTADESAA